MYDTKMIAFFETVTYVSHYTVMFGTFSCHDALHQVMLEGEVIAAKGACHDELHFRLADAYTDPVPGTFETEVLPAALHETAMVR